MNKTDHVHPGPGHGPRRRGAELEQPGSAEHRALARLLAAAGRSEPPRDFARRLQRRIEDLAEQSRWEQGALSLLLAGMAAGAAWQLDLGWLPQLDLPSANGPMLLSAGVACLLAWGVDRVFAGRSKA